MSERKRAIDAVTNDLLRDKFIDEVGSRATVERSSLQSEGMDELRGVLRDVGQNLSDVGAAPKGMTYLGSISVHIYASEVLRTAAFASLTALEGVNFALADAALRELTGSVHESYGKARKKLRSGF